MTFTWDHVLYRFYDGEGALLYVGITKSIRTRFKAHASKQPWWPEVTGCRVEFHQDRAALLRAEHDAIKHERPRYNIRGAPATTLPVVQRPVCAEPAPPLDVPDRLFAVPAQKVPLRQQVTDDEWAWMHNLPPYDTAA